MSANGDARVRAESEACAGYLLLDDLFPDYEFIDSLSSDERDHLATSFERLLAHFNSSFAPNSLCMLAQSAFSSQPYIDTGPSWGGG